MIAKIIWSSCKHRIWVLAIMALLSISINIEANEISTKAEVTAIGIVQDTMTNPSMVTLRHDAIPEFNLPKTSTMFYVAENLNITNLKPGLKVRFTLSKTKDKQIIITKIEIEK